MSKKPIAGRFRVSSEYICSRCGSHEAYCCRSQNAFERYILNIVMVRAVRCCDCDALCYAFPVRIDGHPLSANERVALVARAA